MPSFLLDWYHAIVSLFGQRSIGIINDSPGVGLLTEIANASTAATVTTEVSDVSPAVTPKTVSVSLYFGIACGVVAVIALLGVGYLFLRGLLSKKKEETVALNDLRRYSCRSHSRSCSPDFSPRTHESEDWHCRSPALSADWHTVSPDAT